MVVVKVIFHTYLAQLTLEKEANLTLEDEKNTISDLFQKLVARHGNEFRKFVIDNMTRQIHPTFFILVDGIEINSLEGFDTELKDGNVISIIPPVGGG